MPSYDSDTESEGEYESTSVTLGYASKEPTDDDFSQLGGYPTWLDNTTAPSAALARCKVCNDHMTLLMQLNADMPEHIPGHERRLYVFSCRRKTCRRKEGSVRSVRAVRISKSKEEAAAAKKKSAEKEKENAKGEENKAEEQKQPQLLGEALFGVNKNPASTPANPFSTSAAPANPFSTGASSASSNPNPFASASSLAAKPPQKPTPPTTDSTTTTTSTLPETFAQKARLASPSTPPNTTPFPPQEPWPPQSSLPKPYPSYHLDADYETLATPSTPSIPANARLDPDAAEPSSSGTTTVSAKEEKEAFESMMDKAFQRFADRLAQNPEQVLRYEFRGQPLLYSDTDAVGKLLSASAGAGAGNEKVKTTGAGAKGMPRCGNCGAGRVFEMQLTPGAIAELEAEELGLEGMEWGTVVVGVCERDCGARGVGDGEVGYVEEWTGVQWEELAARK